MTFVDKNVTKTYKKTNPKVPDVITLKDKKIAEKLELDNRVEVSASRNSFITLDDHKPDFINNPTCRLINPSKSEIGIISKNILDHINKEIIQATKVNLWKNTNNTIESFKAIPEKDKHTFITFDVCDFYPSICDVTMGSYDRAETCELIGAKMLSLIAFKFKNQICLYRDDGLKITINGNKKIVNFLDMTFNLANGSYKPYTKPNNKILHVHRQSNHPPALLKNIPLNINKRLTNISSSKEVFEESIAPYQQALKKSGYDHKLT